MNRIIWPKKIRYKILSEYFLIEDRFSDKEEVKIK